MIGKKSNKIAKWCRENTEKPDILNSAVFIVTKSSIPSQLLTGFSPNPNPKSENLNSALNQFSSKFDSQFQLHSMAGVSSDPTRHKHHRSPSDDENDSQGQSKRRKHRHHRHHRHHHRHHHRSKKQDTVEDATQIEAGIEGKEKRQGDRNVSDSDMNDTVANGPPIGGIGSGANGLSLGIDYDMEEGEIIEEVEGSVEGDDWKKKGFDSDVEAGEVKGSNVEVCFQVSLNLLLFFIWVKFIFLRIYFRCVSNLFMVMKAIQSQ